PTAREGWRVPIWAASAGLIVGGIAAQLAGAIPIFVAVGLRAGADLTPESLGRIAEESVLDFAVLGPSILCTGLTLAGIAFVVPILGRRPVKLAMRLRGAHWLAFVLAPIGILALGPTSDLLRRLMETYLPWATFGALEGLDEIARGAPLYVTLPAMALVPGICEELLFRGMFQPSIRRGWLAVILSGTVFAVYHMDPQHVAAVLPLGLYLAWLGDRTKSVFVPITAHVFNNAAAVLGSTVLADSVAGNDEALPWWAAPIGWAVAAAVIVGIMRVTRRDPEREGWTEAPADPTNG
ncbi:MAG: CPBP family glutamic-type intramembrane protease, partial [Sandaracinaceae bacterium]